MKELIKLITGEPLPDWWDRIEELYAALARESKRVFSAISLAALFFGLVWAVQVVPEWQTRRTVSKYGALRPGEAASQMATLQNETRKTFIQIVGGIFVVLGVWLTYRRTIVDEQGHITDRYTKAIEQLGATKTVNDKSVPNVEVRLGAIYALERIAFDSPRDHWTIMEVLTAYVRENAPAPTTELTKEDIEKAIARGPATEIRAILTVLGRRARGGRRERNGQTLDLRQSDLRGAYLSGMHIEGSRFGLAHLAGANLGNVYADGASFAHAYLENANFLGAHLKGASFYGASLKGADLRYVRADDACFIEARLVKADFHEARIKGATFCRSCLQGTNFYGASAEGCFFDDAIGAAHFFSTHLQGAKFDGAKIELSDFRLSHLDGTSFYNTCVREADFVMASGLTSGQVRKAREWEKARFDKNVARELGIVGSDETEKEIPSGATPPDQTSGNERT